MLTLESNDSTQIVERNIGYAGIGSSWSPSDESVKEMILVPNFIAGVQVGISHDFDFRGAFHLAGLGSFGLRLGGQYVIFDRESRVNMALGSDFGGTVLLDKKGTFGYLVTDVLNADFYIPISIKFKPQYRLIITPRYSYNYFSTIDEDKVNLRIPTLTIGLRLKTWYCEASVSRFQKEYYPNIGLIRVLNNLSRSLN
jgi:hypothetical protein